MADDRALRQAREFFGVWNTEGMEAAAERYWDPEIVWEEPPRFPDAGVHHGREDSVRRMRERFDLVGAVEIEVVEADAVDTADGGRHILIEAIVHSAGTSRGARAATREFFLLKLRRGRGAISFREFLDRDDAEAAYRAVAEE